jgi:hypothetical protein
MCDTLSTHVPCCYTIIKTTSISSVVFIDIFVNTLPPPPHHIVHMMDTRPLRVIVYYCKATRQDSYDSIDHVLRLRLQQQTSITRIDDPYNYNHTHGP